MRAQLLPNTALSTPLCQGTSQPQSLYYLYRHGSSTSLLCLLYSPSDPLSPNHLVWCEGQASPPHLQNTSITFSKKIKSPPLQLQSQPFSTLKVVDVLRIAKWVLRYLLCKSCINGLAPHSGMWSHFAPMALCKAFGLSVKTEGERIVF